MIIEVSMYNQASCRDYVSLRLNKHMPHRYQRELTHDTAIDKETVGIL
jgi:hypothetical protein